MINPESEDSCPGDIVHGPNEVINHLISPALEREISSCVHQSDNLITDIDKLFSIDSKSSQTMLVIMPQMAAIIEEDEMEKYETHFVRSADFLPVPGLTRYKTIQGDGEITLTGHYEGDDDTSGDPYKLKFNRVLRNPSKLRSEIVEYFPSLDRKLDPNAPGEGDSDVDVIFCAVSVRGEYCDIFGVYQIDNGGHSLQSDDDIWAMKEGVDIVANAIHNIAAARSKFNVVVHSSIFDRVANEEMSIPEAFLDRDGGGLEHPMQVKLSGKVAKEMDVSVSDGEFCLFRDKDNLFFSADSPETETELIRIPFSEITDSRGRITSKRIRTSLSRVMALKRDKTGISNSSFTRIRRGWRDGEEEVGTRIGLGLKLLTMNAKFNDTSGHGNKISLRLNNGNAILFYTMIPLMIHLCLARFDPALRGEIKIRSEAKGKKFSRRKTPVNKSRVYDWGTDSIRYVSEGEGLSRSRHWVISHFRKIRIKRESTINFYEKKGFPLIRDNSGVIGFRIIRGHYRGIGSDEWDGDFRFGKRPTYYSAKAIRWLNHISNNENIEIRHAERGGEYRINLSEGYIQVDGYCEKTKTIFEFHGDVYHGNPEVYAPEFCCHPYNQHITAGELFRKTMQREELIRSLGFNLVSIWESDWDAMEKNMIDRIISQS